MPFILRPLLLRPLSDFLSSSFWYPFARLSYGAYLSHSMFMLFREYNAERGTWASQLDCVLFFCAYLVFAYTFSLFVTLLIETPCLRLYREFTKQP